MFESIRNLASSDLPCLICGETGTGKSLLARAIHQASDRQEKSFEPLQCAALPEALIESELLGHVKGSFTGAEVDRDGILVQAHGGTLFLDEVGDMSEGLQRKLLRALDDGVVRPLGAKDSIQVDFRTISATRHSLEQLVDRGVFKLPKLCGKTANSADVGTKDLSEADMRRCLMWAGVVELDGQHPQALGID